MKRYLIKVSFALMVVILMSALIQPQKTQADIDRDFIPLKYKVELEKNEIFRYLFPRFVKHDRYIIYGSMPDAHNSSEQIISLHLLEAENGKQLNQLILGTNVDFEISPNENFVVVYQYDNGPLYLRKILNIKLYSIPDFKLITSIDSNADHFGDLSQVKFANGDRQLFIFNVFVAGDKEIVFYIRQWKLESNKTEKYAEIEFPYDQEDKWFIGKPVNDNSIQLFPDEKRMSFTTGLNGSYRLYVLDLLTGKKLHTFNKQVSIDHFIPEQNIMIMNGMDDGLGYPEVHDLDTYETKSTLVTPTIHGVHGLVMGSSILSSGKQLVDSYGDGIIRTWDLSTGKITDTLTTGDISVTHILLRDDKTIISDRLKEYSSTDVFDYKDFNIWSLKTGKLITPLYEKNNFTYIHSVSNRYMISSQGVIPGATFFVWDLKNIINQDEIAIDTYIDGQKTSLSAQPKLINGSVLLPLRDLTDALQGNIEWNENKTSMNVKLNGHKSLLTVGSSTAMVDGKEIKLTEPLTMYDGKLFVSSSFLKEGLDIIVDWDSSARIVEIHTLKNDPLNVEHLIKPVDTIQVKLGDSLLQFDQQPLIINSHVMVPLRKIFESLGAEMQWDESTLTITATKGNSTIKLTIGENIAIVNNANVTLDAPPLIINNRTLVPVRFIGESFGSKVNWDEVTNTVLISKE